MYLLPSSDKLRGFSTWPIISNKCFKKLSNTMSSLLNRGDNCRYKSYLHSNC